jgi:prepilin-type N-terminal cleavage/methylation domain-containing protein
MTSRAFTLIELLVVVLIIGILAAIALPQYQAAVLKSKFASSFPLLKSIASAQERYRLVNGNSYAVNFEDLDITVSGNSGDCTGTSCTVGNNTVAMHTHNGCALVYFGGSGTSSLTNAIIFDETAFNTAASSDKFKKGDFACYDRSANIGSDKFVKVCKSFSPRDSADGGGGKMWIIN